MTLVKFDFDALTNDSYLRHKEQNYEFSSKFFRICSSKSDFQTSIQIDERISSNTVERICDYLHNRSFEINVENVIELLYLAEFLQIDQLIEICKQFIDNCQDKKLTIFKILHKIKFELSHDAEEEAICRDITSFIAINAFYLLSTDYILMLIKKTNLKSSQIITIIKKMKEMQIPLSEIAMLYGVLEYKYLSLDDKEYIILECENCSDIPKNSGVLIYQIMDERLHIVYSELYLERDKVAELTDPQFNVGDLVTIIGSYTGSKTDSVAPLVDKIGENCWIREIDHGSYFPYHIGDDDGSIGWCKATSLIHTE